MHNFEESAIQKTTTFRKQKKNLNPLEFLRFISLKIYYDKGVLL